MSSELLSFVLLVSCTSSLAGKSSEPNLPLCPTSVQYFPQNLPMHCRMPRSTDSKDSSKGATPDKLQAMPFPVPVSFPGGMPPQPPSPSAPMPMPGPMPMPMPMPMPGPMPMAMAAPMGMPMPMPLAPPAHKLPVIVMPFYSPDPNYKKGKYEEEDEGKKKRRRAKHKSHDTSTDNSDDSDGRGRKYAKDSTDGGDSEDSDDLMVDRWSNRRSSRRRPHHKRRRQNKAKLLTPVIQYVTKDGYVIYEKEISKYEARDWLNMQKQGEAPPDNGKATYSEIDEFAAADEPPKNVIELNSKPLPKLAKKFARLKAKKHKIDNTLAQSDK